MTRIKYLIMLSSAVASLACADHTTNPVEHVPGGVQEEDPPAKGKPAPAHGTIAFASTRGARWQSPDIYIAKMDGSDVRRITLGTAPAWSWDGQKIAFHRDSNPYDRYGVYVANADGSDERFVSPGDNPAWSPDGRLAFGTYNSGIAVSNADGSRFQVYQVDNERWYTNAADIGCADASWRGSWADHPAWSPDGKRIAFVILCGDGGDWSRLFLMNADGSEVRPLSDSRSAGPPAWSPDGSKIAAWIDGALVTIDVNSGEQKVYHRPANGVYHRLGTPYGVYGMKLDWSPDGRRIVFAAGSSDKEPRIFVLASEAGEVSQLIPDVWLRSGVPDWYWDFDVAWARVKQ